MIKTKWTWPLSSRGAWCKIGPTDPCDSNEACCISDDQISNPLHCPCYSRYYCCAANNDTWLTNPLRCKCDPNLYCCPQQTWRENLKTAHLAIQNLSVAINSTIGKTTTAIALAPKNAALMMTTIPTQSSVLGEPTCCAHFVIQVRNAATETHYGMIIQAIPCTVNATEKQLAVIRLPILTPGVPTRSASATLVKIAVQEIFGQITNYVNVSKDLVFAVQVNLT